MWKHTKTIPKPFEKGKSYVVKFDENLTYTINEVHLKKDDTINFFMGTFSDGLTGLCYPQSLIADLERVLDLPEKSGWYMTSEKENVSYTLGSGTNVPMRFDRSSFEDESYEVWFDLKGNCFLPEQNKITWFDHTQYKKF